MTAARGTERALKAELTGFGLRGVKEDRGGVRLKGRDAALATICLRSRIAVRVLIRLGEFAAPNEDALYEEIRALEWERWLTADRTLAVSAVSKDSRVHHTGYAAQRVKDAIVDRQRRRGGQRSDVDRRDPDVAVFLRLAADRAQVFLDASGRSLHRRGWRRDPGAAPLKETLAAACLHLAGWDGTRPFLDPMCGSGTLAIEADLMARDVPAQTGRDRFGFERWADFGADGAEALAKEKQRAKERARDDGPTIYASDHDRDAVDRARGHAKAARSQVLFALRGIHDVRPPVERGLIVTNPPYGERLDPGPAFRTELRQMMERFRGWDVAMIVPRDGKGWYVHGPPQERYPVFNGGLACELLLWRGR